MHAQGDDSVVQKIDGIEGWKVTKVLIVQEMFRLGDPRNDSLKVNAFFNSVGRIW
jgi:hypothetical protein